MFYILQENGYVRPELAENIIAAVGFRNLVVHEYGHIDLKQVYQIAHHEIEHLNAFMKSILKKCELA